MKVKILIVVSSLHFLFLNSCNSNKTLSSKKDPALTFMQTNCYTCHSPSASEETRLAPPMIAIKKHYIGPKTTEESFIKDFTSFVLNPTHEKAKMPGAIKRFNLMPKLIYAESDLIKLAKYLYRNEIEKPEWFDVHYQKENQTDAKQIQMDSSYLEKGRKMSSMAQQELAKNLLEALNIGGTEYALGFCNTKAITITDSISGTFNAKLRRVSDLNRNAQNQANENEIAYINLLKENLKNGSPIKPKLVNINGEKKGYYPIITNSLCGQCHGSINDLKPETLRKIKELYPTDKAIGYKENQIRGIWVVEFN